MGEGRRRAPTPRPFAKLSAALTKIHTKSAWWSLAAYGTLHTKKEVSNETDRISTRAWVAVGSPIITKTDG